ncbi:hypothetical protein [Sphingomonas morindae]|uniref:Uncharacterized protein n=1 Tax=Sphingomonas morindae TaxID=1541170 RepID=A0ABY4X4K2_9SPHN|nr:hypothetical protein [Sphingomonas morindae]USI71828.1 hypothetical protein LHA26_10900 [Sphingomonas morindae]
MATRRLTRRERCAAGRHTPAEIKEGGDGEIRRAQCRYCGAPIMRTQATRIWFAAGRMA